MTEQAVDNAAVLVFSGTVLLCWVMYMASKLIDDLTSTPKNPIDWMGVILFFLLSIVLQGALALDAAGLVAYKLITTSQAIALNIAIIPVYVSLTWLFIIWARGDWDKQVSISSEPATRPVVKTVINAVSALSGLSAMWIILM